LSRAIFKPAIFKFLKDLEANNNREWFQANRDRYENELRGPALEFVTEFGAHLLQISPHFRADPRPNGGSLFRIYRDIRFSRDKRPYKDHAGMHFPHEAGRDAHTPGFYLHIQPRNCFVGMGLWRPENSLLKILREKVAADPQAWRDAVENVAFRKTFALEAESLKRVPRGFAADHELAAVLRLKSYTAYAPLTQRQVTSAGFVEEYAQLCRVGGALVKYLCEALGHPY